MLYFPAEYLELCCTIEYPPGFLLSLLLLYVYVFKDIVDFYLTLITHRRGCLLDGENLNLIQDC